MGFLVLMFGIDVNDNLSKNWPKLKQFCYADTLQLFVYVLSFAS